MPIRRRFRTLLFACVILTPLASPGLPWLRSFDPDKFENFSKDSDSGSESSMTVSSPLVTGSLTDSDSKLCDSLRFPSAQRCGRARENCLKALQAAPNKEAVRYAFAYLRDNTGRLADPSCKKGGPAGIKNTGSLLVNDVKTAPGTGYYVNFCDSTEPLKKIRINVGTGTSSGGRGYADTNYAKTTVLGAFMTGAMGDFTPASSKNYADYDNYAKTYGRAQRLHLYGLNSSNNDTASGKPMHESPYNSSSGCPSCKGPECRAIMKALNDDGPSLVVNYGTPADHPSTTDCTNGNGARRASGSGKGSGNRLGGQQ